MTLTVSSCVQLVPHRGILAKLDCLRTADTRISPVPSVDFLLSLMSVKGMMTMFAHQKVKPGRFYDYDQKTKQAVRVHTKQFEIFKVQNQAERALPVNNRWQLTARGLVDFGKSLWKGQQDSTESQVINCPNCETRMGKRDFQLQVNEVGLFDLVYQCQRCGFKWFVPNSVINPKGGHN